MLIKRCFNIVSLCTITKELHLARNDLNGVIPKELGSGCTLLTYLDLSQNPFQGSLPTNLGLLTVLEVSRRRVVVSHTSRNVFIILSL
jgi:hypothetical protein